MNMLKVIEIYSKEKVSFNQNVNQTPCPNHNDSPKFIKYFPNTEKKQFDLTVLETYSFLVQTNIVKLINTLTCIFIFTHIVIGFIYIELMGAAPCHFD